MRAIQKSGMPCRTTTKGRHTRSAHPLRASTLDTAMPIDNSKAADRLIPMRTKVLGRALITLVMAGVPYRNDTPKWPCSTPAMYEKYWDSRGRL